MNLSKLTPCRKVGLSRKKNTPLRATEILLNDENNTDSPKALSTTSLTPNLEKVTLLKRTPKVEQNHDTPVRRVGLSRKRKKIEKNTSTPLSKATLINEFPECKLSTDKLPLQEKDQSSCVKKLSTRYSSKSTSRDTENTKSEYSIGSRKNYNESFLYSEGEINRTEKSSNNDAESPNNQDIVVDPLIHLNEKGENLSGIELFNDSKQDGNEFMKVCYKSEEISFISAKFECSQSEIKNISSDSITKISKFTHKIIDDDDDFEINTIGNRTKKKLKQSKTDLLVLNRKNKDSKKGTEAFKKSLSVGDTKLRTLTESPISSELSISDCFVKLDRMTDMSKQISCKATSQELSNYEFDTFTSTPRENIQTRVNNLDKRIEKKRIVNAQIIGDKNSVKLEKCSNNDAQPPNNLSTVVDPLIHLNEKGENLSGTEHFNDSKQDGNEFIQVCYKSEKISSISAKFECSQSEMKKISSDSIAKTSKFTHKMIDDDDDFEINPIGNRTKKKFKRSKTDIVVLNRKKNDSKKGTKPLKKSLSVGDTKLRSLTESPISSELSISDCFVKLDQMRDKSKQLACKVTTPQELSDDEFDTFTSTPRENIRTRVNNLEKEVEEKRIILEQLKRARLCKKIHNIDELKNLTLRWKNGCTIAINDLLKQLNTHTQIDMTTLLKKLNIPQDFIMSQ